MGSGLWLRACAALLLLSTGLGQVLTAAERQLFIAPRGNDQAPGTEAEPLATLTAAQRKVREWRQAGSHDDARITLAEGDYFLEEPIEFTAEDATAPEAKLLITGAPGAQARISGGKPVNAWRPVTDPSVKQRLTVPAAQGVRVATLPATLLAACGEHCARGHENHLHPSPLEVFYRDEPAQLARWPNQGWATTGQVAAQGSQTRFTSKTKPAKRWQDTRDVWAHGFWEADWSDAWQPLVAADFDRGLLTIQNSAEVTEVRSGARFRVLNVLEELDSPGEWYLDRLAGKLYLWPTGELRDGDVVVSALDHLVSIYDGTNVTIRNVEFTAARVCAVEIARGERVRLEQCQIRNAGNLGVHIVGGEGHAIADCEICQTGEGAIRVSGGDRATLTPATHCVSGNHLHHFARSCFAGRPAILADGVAIRIAGNHIHHGPDSAIVLQGNEHLVEHNDIHHVCLQTADTGAIYLGHDWTERGNVIRHNVIHHLGAFNRRDVMGVYLDDFASGTTVTHNWFFDAGRAVVIGGGRDNFVELNVIIGGVAGVQVDSRGLTWAKDRVAGAQAPLPQLLAAARTGGEVYTQRYPQLATLLQDEPAIAKGNQIANNLIICPIAIDLHDRPTHRAVQVAGNLVTGKSQLGDHPQRDLLNFWRQFAGFAP